MSINKNYIIIGLSLILALVTQYKLNEINQMYLKRDYDLKLLAIQQQIKLSQRDIEPTVTPKIITVTEIQTLPPTAQPMAQPTVTPVQQVVIPVRPTIDTNNLSMPHVSSISPQVPNTEMVSSADFTDTVSLSEIWTVTKQILIDMNLWQPAQTIVSIMFVVAIAFIILSYFKP